MTERYLGLMSGTSLDGVDLVFAEIDKPFAWKILAFDCKPFNSRFKGQLKDLLETPFVDPIRILTMHQRLGRYFGDAINTFLEEQKIERDSITAIGLHGVTYQHRPNHGATWQLGDMSGVREITGIRTISEFRAADMALGGEGAPLVPFLDELVFRDKKENRILLNLGGIANLTFLGRDGGAISAFDTGPANMLIDGLMRRHPTNPMDYDPEGKHGAAGRVNEALLNQLLRFPYFEKPAPKSTGREDFGDAFLDAHFVGHVPFDDMIATVTWLSARTIGDAIKRTYPSFRAGDRLIASGGGIHNKTLMGMLAEALPGIRVCTTNEFGLDGDAKEALLMAALAWAYNHGVPGNHPEVTGASRATVLGVATY